MSWRRGSRPDRKRWRKARFLALTREAWTCRRCGRWGNIVDHIRPLFEDGEPYAPDNLQVLCKSCHLDKCRLEQTKPQPPEVKAWDAYLIGVV